ncbi:MAG: fatty acid desaturase, partial [Polyangiaceae bacterium]
MKSLDAKLVQLIQDPRDLPFLHLMLQCAVVACCGIGLFFAKGYFWYLVPVYWVLWFAWVVDRFILMLHCTSHRMLFKKQYRALNYVIPWLLGPFFGETPES